MRKCRVFVLFAFVFSFYIISCQDGNLRYNVIFNLCGGHIEGDINSRIGTAIHGDKVFTSEFPEDPEKENYVFGGWFTAERGFGNTFTKSTKVYSNLTVYAKWIIDSESTGTAL